MGFFAILIACISDEHDPPGGIYNDFSNTLDVLFNVSDPVVLVLVLMSV